jgi:hypothetical protein
LPAGARHDLVHLSFERAKLFTVDHHEDGNTIAKNSLNQPTSQSGALTADEYDFSQFGANRYNSTFYGNTVGMVALTKKKGGQFRSQLDHIRDLDKNEIWIRTSEVFNGSSLPAQGTGFKLGLEDEAGNLAWADSDAVGGVPRPYDRGPETKTMLKTLRFPVHCFLAAREGVNLKHITAIRIQLDRQLDIALAFDVLQIV